MEFTRGRSIHEERKQHPAVALPDDEDGSGAVDDDKEFDEKRVWIGNIDTCVAEYLILKLVQQYGELVNFDYVYHKSGADSGKPRGFCFVTYTTPASASQAIKQLHGYKLKSKHLMVRLANRGRSTATQPVVGTGSHTRRHEDKIAELEAKLLSMQNQQTVDVKTKLTQSIAPPSLLRIQTRATNSTAEYTQEQRQQQRCNSVDSKHKHRSKPYDRG